MTNHEVLRLTPNRSCDCGAHVKTLQLIILILDFVLCDLFGQGLAWIYSYSDVEIEWFVALDLAVNHSVFLF